MKKIILLLLLVTGTAVMAEAQLLKKLKDKVEKKVTEKIDPNSGNSGNNNPDPGNNQNNDNNGNNGRPVNKGGGGLKNTTPPDVNVQITEATQFHDAGKYSEARYAVQQALMGVEIQLGREILKSLPQTADAMAADTTQDKVVSTAWGWSNMTIQRVYSDKKDKQLTISIGNNALYSGLVFAYFNNSMVQANADNQNAKSIKVKGYKALITYDDSKGYTLIVPIGQTSMIIWECINFSGEDEVTKTAGEFDIDGIKKTLGEK